MRSLGRSRSKRRGPRSRRRPLWRRGGGRAQYGTSRPRGACSVSNTFGRPAPIRGTREPEGIANGGRDWTMGHRATRWARALGGRRAWCSRDRRLELPPGGFAVLIRWEDLSGLFRQSTLHELSGGSANRADTGIRPRSGCVPDGRAPRLPARRRRPRPRAVRTAPIRPSRVSSRRGRKRDASDAHGGRVALGRLAASRRRRYWPARPAPRESRMGLWARSGESVKGYMVRPGERGTPQPHGSRGYFRV